jgi:hypothetical protein
VYEYMRWEAPQYPPKLTLFNVPLSAPVLFFGWL